MSPKEFITKLKRVYRDFDDIRLDKGSQTVIATRLGRQMVALSNYDGSCDCGLDGDPGYQIVTVFFSNNRGHWRMISPEEALNPDWDEIKL